MRIQKPTYGEHYTMVVVGLLFGSREVGSCVRLFAVDNVVSFPVDVGTKFICLSKRLIRKVVSHTEMYD